MKKHCQIHKLFCAEGSYTFVSWTNFQFTQIPYLGGSQESLRSVGIFLFGFSQFTIPKSQKQQGDQLNLTVISSFKCDTILSDRPTGGSVLGIQQTNPWTTDVPFFHMVFFWWFIVGYFIFDQVLCISNFNLSPRNTKMILKYQLKFCVLNCYLSPLF